MRKKNKKSSTKLASQSTVGSFGREPDPELKKTIVLSSNKQTFLIKLKEEKNPDTVYSVSVKELEEVKKKYREKYQIEIVVNGETKYGKKLIEEKYKNAPLLSNQKAVIYYNLTYEEMLIEIDEIQKDIKDIDQKPVPYFYTCGAREEVRRHFELIFIGKNFIINPIKYPYNNSSPLKQRILREDFASSDKAFYDTDLTLLRKENPEDFSETESKTHDKIMIVPPCPLGGIVGCKALALKYVKNLFKENATQLKDFCLKIPFLNHKNQLFYFFFPSPQVLYYSQSGQYNDALVSLLTSNEPSVQIKCKIFNGDEKLRDQTFYFKTISALLKESIQMAAKTGNTTVQASNCKILEDLQNFRARWMKEYYLVSSKRELMVETKDAKHNRALLYAARQYSKYPLVDKLKQHSKQYLSSAKQQERAFGFLLSKSAADLADLSSQLYVADSYYHAYVESNVKEELDNSLHYYQMAVDQGHSKSMYRLGMLRYENGQFPEAKNLFDLAIKAGNLLGHFGLAFYYYSDGKYKQAAHHSKIAIEKANCSDPNMLEQCKKYIAKWHTVLLSILKEATGITWNYHSSSAKAFAEFNEAAYNHLLQQGFEKSDIEKGTVKGKAKDVNSIRLGKKMMYLKLGSEENLDKLTGLKPLEKQSEQKTISPFL